MFFFCKQKTAYEMRISDWSSDVCSSDLAGEVDGLADLGIGLGHRLATLVGHDAEQVTSVAGHLVGDGPQDGSALGDRSPPPLGQLGRASCRERVCPYV